MKILAVNGSPNRNGSTAKLIDMILAVCQEAGAECESIHLEDYVIGECTGCVKCVNGGEFCQDDDYIQLKAKMLDVDGIIIGSPYYSGKPTAQIKTFLDRLAFTSAYHRYFQDKYIVGVSTSAVSNAKKIAKYCASLGNISFMGNGIVSGLLYENTVDKVVMGDIADNIEIKDKAKKVAEKLIEDIKKKRKSALYHIKKLVFRKWINIPIVRLMRKIDWVKAGIRHFGEERGWIKKVNKIED